ncbi:hypothetical protein CMO96_04015 [Candidatus Woesebacteria bacterium]|nr:hypothetical protein [Candidatus Woesebacteria bacterium]|tara:strand:+ start:239 stop:943 length:705 start_codon:yes stop_codon:yes gene_type:complete
MIDRAIILAGGEGQRLRPYTDDKPKPMVEVAGKPIISYQLSQFTDAGVKEVVFACSYRREVLEKHMGSGKSYGVKARFSIEENPLGRGGGIKQAMKQLEGNWKNVLITNGDNLWHVDLVKFIKMHEERDALASIVVVPLKSPYGIVDFNKRKEVLGFREKPVLPYWINAGIYVFSREIEPMLPDIGDHETEMFPKLPKNRFLVFQSQDYWRGVDTVKDLAEAEKEVGEVFSSNT